MVFAVAVETLWWRTIEKDQQTLIVFFRFLARFFHHFYVILYTETDSDNGIWV